MRACSEIEIRIEIPTVIETVGLLQQTASHRFAVIRTEQACIAYSAD